MKTIAAALLLLMPPTAPRQSVASILFPVAETFQSPAVAVPRFVYSVSAVGYSEEQGTAAGGTTTTLPVAVFLQGQPSLKIVNVGNFLISGVGNVGGQLNIAFPSPLPGRSLFPHDKTVQLDAWVGETHQGVGPPNSFSVYLTMVTS